MNSRISSASCQCIHIRIAAVPVSVSVATRKRLRVSPTNLSRVSRSVTRCVVTVPLPRLSYSLKEMRLSRSIRRIRKRYTMSLANPANRRACSTLKTSPAPRRARVSTNIKPM
ncbi:hypothetical protein D3C76_1256330 [compost metagenome]